LPAALVGWLRRKPVIVTVHEVWGGLWRRLPGIPPALAWGFQLYERLIMALPYQRYVCVSKATEKELNRLYPRSRGKSTVVYNGLDLPSVTPAAHVGKQEVTVLFYGRPGVAKGLESLITAANACVNPKVSLRLVVSRDESARYELLRGMIASPRIHMEPSLPRADLMRAIVEADYVVVPSLCEGFGFAALEACLLGKRLLCSNQGALREVVSGQVAFFDPWQPAQLTALLGALPEVAFETIPPRRFPLADTLNGYLALY